jgi:small subunit ribosomal protein S1
MVVAIDGPAGVGKSTVARLIADRTGFFYLNSGNFYRGITFAVAEAGIDPGDTEAVIRLAKESRLRLEGDRLFLGDRDIDDLLHTDRIDRLVAQISSIPAVRDVVNERLRSVASERDIVVEGRDITTVVFPEADLKFYFDASAETRALRRFSQGTSNLSLDEIAEGIRKRDSIDRSKPVGNLTIAKDAIYLDTSDLTIDQVCEKVVANIREHQGRSGSNMEVMAEKDIRPTEDSKQTQLQEEYLKSLEQLEEGQLVEGTVVEVTSDNVFIDVGYKSEGKIPLQEFKTPPAQGDTVTVVLIRKETREGELIVSKSKADAKIAWRNIRNAFQEHQPVEGKIVKSIKGGFEVDLGYDVRGFMPISKADVQRVENPEEYVGITSMFLIERLFSDGRVNIIVSRREWLEQESTRRQEEFFSTVNIGDEVTGTVKSFTSFGAFIDLGGFDGLLHINDMSWGHVTRPKDFVRKGQEITLKVIRLDPENRKVNLSLKHFTPDPWSTFEDKYQAGDIVKGKVTKLTDFGAFIELEEGIEGLAHISELSWVKRVKHPKELLKVGDEVDTKILGYDVQQGRISLGLKQVYQNPWDTLLERYQVGMRMVRTVKKITNVGAFVELEEGIDGFLHVDELSWTKRIKHPSAMLQEGQEIEVMVIDVNPEERNIRLGVKQLSEDPWTSLRKAYPVGSQIEGTVTSVTDFGVFVKVQGDIEGLINKMNLVDPAVEEFESAAKRYNVGDTIRAVVTELNPGKQKLSLSVRELMKKQQREELSKYIQDDDSGSTMTLGDILKDRENHTSET